MSFLLWTDEKADEAVSLGSPLLLFPAFAEISRVVGNDASWKELQLVPLLGEQTVNPEWLFAVQRQARKFLAEHGRKVGDHARWILRTLSQAARNTFFPGLTNQCVYTIKHSDDLRKTIGKSGKGKFQEQKTWVRAKELLDEARRIRRSLPIVFAPAEGTAKLFGWAILTNIEFGEGTTYHFGDLVKFKAFFVKTSLRKASNGVHLSEGFIRPYAICETPDFLFDEFAKRRKNKKG